MRRGSQVLQVKEFFNDVTIEKEVNEWLSKNQDKKIINIKYSANIDSANVLIVYEEDK